MRLDWKRLRGKREADPGGVHVGSGAEPAISFIIIGEAAAGEFVTRQRYGTMPEGNGRVTGPMTGEAARRGEPVELPPPSLGAPQHFYWTAALPCPYVPGRIERKLITELAGHGSAEFYNALSRAGFRRSHHLAYRPACAGCTACQPVRIPAADFILTRSLRRIRGRNADLRARVTEPRATLEQYRLFTRYQRSRHADSDMASMTFGDFRAMIEDSPVTSRLVELRDGDGACLGACLFDLLDDGLSAVYSFFDPEERRRSLGTHLVLTLIDEGRRRALPYVYLGYWIAESPKMAYKVRFRPLEGLGPQGWHRLSV
jgi:leucyl-tRNA---protein transferase